MVKKHWVLLNAPPLAGKDTLANLLINKYDGYHIKFSQPLKDGLKAFFSLTDEQYLICETPENKSTPTPLLNGLSWRQAQIDLAEILARPIWGKDTFVKIAANKSNNKPQKVIIVSDLGFAFERDWFINWNQFKTLTIVNIEREGKTYEGDSREMVFLNPVTLSDDSRLTNITVINNGLPEDMLRQVVRKLPFDNEVE